VAAVIYRASGIQASPPHRQHCTVRTTTIAVSAKAAKRHSRERQPASAVGGRMAPNRLASQATFIDRVRRSDLDESRMQYEQFENKDRRSAALIWIRTGANLIIP
jgi:hypothetical protein